MSIEMVSWKCDRCGATETYPHNEQPMCESICLVGYSKYSKQICGGTVSLDSEANRGVKS